MMRSICAAMSLLMVAGSAMAQPMADRVPGDALVYFGWSGSESMGPGYAGSHLEAVLQASQMSELVNQSIPKLLAKLGATDRDAAQAVGLVSAIGGPMWRHPTAFYFGGLANGPNGGAMPKLALLCNAGGEAPALAGQLKSLTTKMNAPFEVKVEEQGGLVMLSVGAAGWGAGQKPAQALADDPTFKASLAQAQKDSVLAVYINVEGITALANQMLANSPDEAQWVKVRDALGLGGINQIIATGGFDGKDWTMQAFVAAPVPRKGLLPGFFNAAPLSKDILKTIPQSATVAAAGKFDLGGLIAAIRNGAAELDPQVGQMVDGGLAQVRDMLGLDIQKDLFDLFGDEWAVYTDPMTAGSGMMSFALVNRPRDPAKLEASLTKLEDMANELIRKFIGGNNITLEFKRTRVDGATLHYIGVPFVSPSWAIKDGNWYFGLYPQVVEAALQQGSAGGKSILDNEDYLAVQRRLGDHPASGVSFANLPKTAPEAYQEVLLMSRMYLGMADMVGGDTPAMLFPPLRKIMPHLSPAGSVSWTDEAGWHSKSISPFPGSGLLTPGGGGQMLVAQQALLVSILLPSLNKARETANRVKCAANEKQIGLAIMLYANDSKGKYPPDLGTLVKTEDIGPEVFICPTAGDQTVVPRFEKLDDAAKWVSEHSDYIYLGGAMDTRTGGQTIVLYEKPGAHQGRGMNVLFGDGHVEFMSMEESLRMIRAQKAKQGGGK